MQLWTRIRLSSTIKFLLSMGLQRNQSFHLAFEVTKTPMPVIKEFIYNLVSLCLFPLNQQAFQGLRIQFQGLLNLCQNFSGPLRSLTIQCSVCYDRASCGSIHKTDSFNCCSFCNRKWHLIWKITLTNQHIIGVLFPAFSPFLFAALRDKTKSNNVSSWSLWKDVIYI